MSDLQGDQDLIGWREDDVPCPECGAVAEIGDWWDDSLEYGGACIGTLHRCTQCDWYDRR